MAESTNSRLGIKETVIGLSLARALLTGAYEMLRQLWESFVDVGVFFVLIDLTAIIVVIGQSIPTSDTWCL